MKILVVLPKRKSGLDRPVYASNGTVVQFLVVEPHEIESLEDLDFDVCFVQAELTLSDEQMSELYMRCRDLRILSAKKAPPEGEAQVTV